MYYILKYITFYIDSISIIYFLQRKKNAGFLNSVEPYSVEQI